MTRPRDARPGKGRLRTTRPLALLTLAALLLLGAAGNVLAEGVHASGVQLYAGLPGLGGRLVGRSAGRRPEGSSDPHVLITTLSYAPSLLRSWAAAERAGPSLDPGADGFGPHRAVILSETHSEGRVHSVLVHPDDVSARIPAPHAPIHPVDARGAAPQGGGRRRATLR